MVGNDKNVHKALVCVIYGVEITETDCVCQLSRDNIFNHNDRLSAQCYNKNFEAKWIFYW